jgi:hypothetical protein
MNEYEEWIMPIYSLCKQAWGVYFALFTLCLIRFMLLEIYHVKVCQVGGVRLAYHGYKTT